MLGQNCKSNCVEVSSFTIVTYLNSTNSVFRLVYSMQRPLNIIDQNCRSFVIKTINKVY